MRGILPACANALAHRAACSNEGVAGKHSDGPRSPDERSDIRPMLPDEKARISPRLRGGHPGYGYCSPGRAATISHPSMLKKLFFGCFAFAVLAFCMGLFESSRVTHFFHRR